MDPVTEETDEEGGIDWLPVGLPSNEAVIVIESLLVRSSCGVVDVRCGRHISPSPPPRHKQTGVPVLAPKLQVLFLAVSGPKQSASASHESQGPIETAAIGNPDAAVTTPLNRLQRRKNRPSPAMLTFPIRLPVEGAVQLLFKNDMTPLRMFQRYPLEPRMQ
jgi:hypothetical protein